MYKIRDNQIVRLSDGALIPVAEDNGDYQQYLQWQALGNQAKVEDLTPALESAKASVGLKIKLYGADRRIQLTGPIGPPESASWTEKERQAKAYMASGNPADAPMLALESSVRGVTLDFLVRVVLGNAEGLRLAEAYFAGIQGRHYDTMQSLPTAQAVLAYDYTTDWDLPPLSGMS